MPRLLARLSTRAKISLSFALLVIASFGLLSALGADWIDRHARELHAKRLEDDAARLALLLDVGLFERLSDITNLADSIDAPLSAGVAQADIERLQATFPRYAWIGVADTHGRVTTSTHQVLAGADVSRRAWWAQGLRAPVVLDVHEAALLKPYLASLVDPADPAPPRLLDVAAPIRVDGQAVGVLGAHLSWRWAEDMDAQAGELVRSEQVSHFVFAPDGTNLRLQPSQGNVHPDSLAGLVNRPAQVVRWSDGQRYLTAAVRRAHGYRDYPGLGWTVVVRQPEAVVSGPVRALVRTSWVLIVATGGLLMLFAWWATGLLLRPLRQAAEVARGVQPPGNGLGADEAVQLSAALRDLVLQLRAREADLTALTADLEQRVAQRTEQLEARNAELRGMARMITHDVRAPILSTAQLLTLARSAPAESQARVLDAAVRECEHVGEVIDALHALSTSESRPLQRTEVDMRELAQQAADRQRVAHGFTGTVAIGPLPACDGDPVLLGEVWANLIGNAMKFSRLSPSPRVTVSGELCGGRAEYHVSDNGIGFDPTAAAELFNAFVRLSRDGRYPGTGLGLAIVRRIVERHGGQVEAASAPGEGATFTFSVPTGGTR